MDNVSTELLPLSWAEVCGRRLDRHALMTPSRAVEAADVVSAICGAHAQVLAAAELSLALRLPALTRTQLGQALWSEHTLIKTLGPRGTVHLLPAHELAMWCGALSALPRASSALDKEARLTPEQSEAVIEAIGLVLEEAELTVDELTEALVESVGSWAGDLVMPAFQTMWPRWRQVVDIAANRGLLCFGPNRGRKVTYTNPRRWLPGFQPVEGEAALAALVRRYLHAYGPATPQHFAQWLAVPKRWAGVLFDAMAAELNQVEVEGLPAWQLAQDRAAPAIEPNGVRLLPYFDAYVVGCHPRQLLFAGRAAERALAHGQAGNFPVLLIDGVVAGVWHQRTSGRKIVITVEPFAPLSIAQRCELDDQVERIGAFFEAKPQLTIGVVSVGAHA